MAHQRHYSFFFLYAVVALGLATLKGIHGVDFVVTNNAETTSGGILFNNQIGADYTRQTMEKATNFIWGILRQNTDADRRNVATVTLRVEPTVIVQGQNVPAATTRNDNVIRMAAEHITGDDAKTEFTGVLYHEMTHVWQSYGANSKTGVTEGIADFVRLKANYIPSDGHWVRPGGGDSWDHGYDVTARFLDYCEGLRSGFVAELNKMMRDTYSDDYFRQLLGKPVDQLWSEYKAAYGG